MNYDEEAPFEVARYREMQKALPGVDALYRLALAHLETVLPQGGHILVVGAGGGREVEALAGSRVPFTVTGADPSADMLDIARWHAEASARPEDVTLIQGVAQDVAAPAGGFDAATSLLVMHFLPDDASDKGKASYLRTIREKLRPGALLVHADVSFDDDAARAAFAPVFLRHAALAGLDEKAAATGPGVIETMPIISARRTEQLLAASGFGAPTIFFQALWYRAWVAKAVC